MELDNVDEERLEALTIIISQKKRMSRRYNKRIKRKKFEASELV